MKSLSKITLAAYVLFLVWLILFKFSGDIPSVLAEYQTRSLNLIPFANVSQANITDVIYNFVAFVPLGLLLGVNFKQVTLWRKLAFVLAFSLGLEVTQFVLAIGATDITDVIANTSGGFLALLLYSAGYRHAGAEKQDRFIVVAGAILLIVFILLRTFVFRVNYR
jgi:glycopeptide antibiotics resistance protein